MDVPTGQLDDGETALVLTTPFDDEGTAVCFDHLTGGERRPQRVMNVLFTRRPRRRIRNWEHRVGELPESFVVVSSQEPSTRPSGVEIETVGRPGDLTDIGVAVTDHLSRWSPETPTAFCLHSITAQLQYADREQIYQFLHTLCGHLTERRVVGHVHMNPNAHDEETIDTFETLFDAVLEVDADGPNVTTS